ncbi:MAG: carbamoyl phosphate synthase large subunit, partial [Candidatus Omnitrophica bacterium]|nr:carbamoyl phosphate synthase large subunit [Candidatus Omnitrophota bacterium]
CVVKTPKFNFEKFPGAIPVLGTAMKSVGEVMAIGRTFKEALQKALRSLEESYLGLEDIKTTYDIVQGLKIPNPHRVFLIKKALKEGMTIDQIYQLSKIDRWFLANIKEIVETEKEIEKYKGKEIGYEIMKKAKELGFSDSQIGKLIGKKEQFIRKLRKKYGIEPDYKCVDTCAGEFVAYTPYYYSTYEHPEMVNI